MSYLGRAVFPMALVAMIKHGGMIFVSIALESTMYNASNPSIFFLLLGNASVTADGLCQENGDIFFNKSIFSNKSTLTEQMSFEEDENVNNYYYCTIVNCVLETKVITVCNQPNCNCWSSSEYRSHKGILIGTILPKGICSVACFMALPLAISLVDYASTGLAAN